MTTPLNGPSGPDSLLPVAPPPVDAPPSGPSGPSGPVDTLENSNTPPPVVSLLSLNDVELPVPTSHWIGLKAFLTHISEKKLDHKKTTQDDQEFLLNMNRDFFLGLSQEAVNILNIREVARKYFRDQNKIIDNQNALIKTLNDAITEYVGSADETNIQIQQLQQAIDTFNAADPNSPNFPAKVNQFNQAVDAFNQYVTDSGDPALAKYQEAITAYEEGTEANQQDVTDFNTWVDEQKEKTQLDLHHMTLNAPTAPSGVTELPPQATYPDAGTPPNIPPYTPSSIPTISPQDPIPNIDDDITQLVTEAVEKLLAKLALMRTLFKNISDYNAFVAFTLRTGTTPTAAAITAYLANTEKPALNSAGSTGSQGGSVSMASSIMGLDSPFLEGKTANALYAATVENFEQEVAQIFLDQLNILNDQIVSTASQKAGFNSAEVLGEQAEVVDDAVLETLVTALFLEEMLEMITAFGDSLKPALENLLKEAGVPQEDITQLLNELSQAQGLDLALTGALAVGIAIGDTGFVGDLLASIPSISGVTSEVFAQPVPTVFTVVSDPTNQLLIKTSLNQEILNDETVTADDARLKTLNDAVDRAIAQSNQDTKAEDFRNTLRKDLIAQEIDPKQASQLADKAFEIVQGLTTPKAPTTPISTADLAASVTATLTEKLAPLGAETAKAIAEGVGRLIYNPLNPANTLAKLIENYIDAQTKISDKAREDVVRELLGVVPPTKLQVVKPAVLLLQLLDPGYNISKSFMTGLMYDRAIPTNFKRPLDIQV